MAYSQTELNMLAAAGLSPTGGPFDWTSLLPKSAAATPAGFTPATGGTPFSTGDPYGKIPQLPAYTTDTSTTTGADYWGQLQAAGGPGVLANLRQGVGAIGSHIAGQVAPTTLADIGSYAAMIGSGGMGMGTDAPGVNTSALKLLGLKAEDLTKQGLGEQSQLYTTFPYQQGSTTKTTTDWSALQSILNAAPDPAARAQAEMAAIAAGLNRGGWGGGGGGGIYNPLPDMIAAQLRPTTSYQKPSYGGVGATPGNANAGWSTAGAYIDDYGNIIYPGLGETGATPEDMGFDGGYGGTVDFGDEVFSDWYDY